MNYTGTKYNPDMDITDVAKAIRKDIKRATKEGQIDKSVKVSVTCRRYSGGQSLDVTIKDWNGKIHNREWVREHVNMEPHKESRFTSEASDLIHMLDDIVNQYNYNKSDTMVDYHDANFYEYVDFDTAMNNAQFEAVVAELKEEKRDPAREEERAKELAAVAKNIAKSTIVAALNNALETQRFYLKIAAEVEKNKLVYPSTRERADIKEMIECEITNMIEYVLTDDMRN